MLGDLRKDGDYGDLPEDIEIVPWDIYAETHARAEWCTTYKGEVQKGVGLVFGFPTWNAVIPKYEYNIGYHVCDVSSIPERWVKGMNLMDHILTPSHWCAQVFGACGVKPERTVVPHGVSVEYQEGVEPSDDTFCFLHFCSAEDPTRKGTLRLVEAFETVYKAMPGARLEIHSDSTLVRCVYGWKQASVTGSHVYRKHIRVKRVKLCGCREHMWLLLHRGQKVLAGFA